MNCNRCSNVGTMHGARSGNSSADEYRLRGDHRTGCTEGERSSRGCHGHPTRVWVRYPGWVNYSEQLSCSKQFDPGTVAVPDNHRTSGPEGGRFDVRYVRGVW